MLAFLSSALAQSILRDRPAAVVGISFTLNPISYHRNCSSKNILNHMAIYVIFILSIIVN